jgi:penicillin-binding protein 2
LDVSPAWYVPLGQISVETAQTHYETLSSLPGVQLRRAWTRAYRSEVIAPHLIGVIGPIPAEELDDWLAKGYEADELVGRMGLERWGETALAGQRGGRLEIVSEQGHVIGVLAERRPTESSSLYTTFDRNFQYRVQEILGERLGAIVVLEAHTGRVLALATYPNFDPNRVAFGAFGPTAAGFLSEEDWQALQNDPRRPLVNRATQGIYPAASIFKVVTMAAGMGQLGLTGESVFSCNGVWSGLGTGLTKTCWLRSGHGSISLADALVASCDVTFYEVGLMLNNLDPEALPEYARRCGFGALTGIEVEEASGLVPDPGWKVRTKGEGWAPGDTVNLAIGQGELLVTPLQVAVLMAAVGNGGTVYRPSLVEMVAADPTNPERTFAPVATGQLPISAENLKVIQDSLQRVTADATGTGYEAFRGLDLAVAGKTGTAETGQEIPHSWFAGYAPANAPDIAIAVIVENAGTGAEYAALLFRRVVEAYY